MADHAFWTADVRFIISLAAILVLGTSAHHIPRNKQRVLVLVQDHVSPITRGRIAACLVVDEERAARIVQGVVVNREDDADDEDGDNEDD